MRETSRIWYTQEESLHARPDPSVSHLMRRRVVQFGTHVGMLSGALPWMRHLGPDASLPGSPGPAGCGLAGFGAGVGGRAGGDGYAF